MATFEWLYCAPIPLTLVKYNNDCPFPFSSSSFLESPPTAADLTDSAHSLLRTSVSSEESLSDSTMTDAAPPALSLDFAAGLTVSSSRVMILSWSTFTLLAEGGWVSSLVASLSVTRINSGAWTTLYHVHLKFRL